MFRIILYAAILFMVSGCFYNNKPLKLGTSPWIGYEAIYQAKEFQWIDTKVELVESTLASQTFKKLVDGEVDAATITIDDFLLARSKGIDLKILAVLDVSAGSDVILSKTPMKDLSELKGKRIALDDSALGMLMLTKLLEKANLTRDDVILKFIPSDEQPKAWIDNQIDVAITYEPFASKLYGMSAHYLISTHEFSEMIFDVLVVKADKIKERESTLQQLIDGHFKALEYLHLNYQDTVYRIATRENISPDDVKRTLGGVILPSLAANRTYLSKNSELMNALEELNTVMYDKQFLTRKAPLDDIFDTRFLKEQ